MGRAPCCEKASVKKGPWSPEEDAQLKSYIEKHGTGGNWIALQQKIGLKRCGKSCRLRWLNYLRPNINREGFSEEENNIICSLYACIGSRWSLIASQLPGRTDNHIKNYWNTRLKKKFYSKQLRKEQLTHFIKGSSNDMIMKREENEGRMDNSLFAAGENQNHYWPDYTLNDQSSNIRNLLVQLDGRFSSKGKESIMSDGTSFGFKKFQEQPNNLPPSSSSSSMDSIPQFSHTQYDTEIASGLQIYQGQSENEYNDEFLFSDSVVNNRLLGPMTCGESDGMAWGYFSSLMALPPSSSEQCEGLIQQGMPNDCTYSTIGSRY